MRFIATVSLLALVACSKAEEPKPTEKSAPPSTVAAPTPAASATAVSAASEKEIAWDAPSAWTSAPNPNPMRKATYKIPKAAGDTEDAELTVSSAGGGVDRNVERWASQFGGAKPKTEARTVHDLKVTIVEIKGTFAGGGGPMMGGAAATSKEKQMLLGAVVDSGDTQHFFKMVGPEKTVTAARKDFEKLVSSLHAK